MKHTQRLTLAVSAAALVLGVSTTPVTMKAAESGITPPAGYHYFAAPDGAVLMPDEFFYGALDRIHCESTWQPNVRNKISGAAGLMQVNLSAHAADMRKRNLDPDRESHRLWFAAYVIYPQQGWGAWDCLGK